MNTIVLVCGFVLAVIMVVFLAKHIDETPKESKFNDNDEYEM